MDAHGAKSRKKKKKGSSGGRHTTQQFTFMKIMSQNSSNTDTIEVSFAKCFLGRQTRVSPRSRQRARASGSSRPYRPTPHRTAPPHTAPHRIVPGLERAVLPGRGQRGPLVVPGDAGHRATVRSDRPLQTTQLRPRAPRAKDGCDKAPAGKRTAAKVRGIEAFSIVTIWVHSHLPTDHSVTYARQTTLLMMRMVPSLQPMANTSSSPERARPPIPEETAPPPAAVDDCSNHLKSVAKQSMSMACFRVHGAKCKRGACFRTKPKNQSTFEGLRGSGLETKRSLRNADQPWSRALRPGPSA